MKILYIHQYFNIPSVGGPTRSYWVSKELLKHGHNVTMLTTRGDKNVPYKEYIDGIEVISIYVPYSGDFGLVRRFFSFIKFMCLSTIYVLKSKSYNLIIATSTPLTIGLPALFAKKIKKTPYIFEVRDLWPEVPIQMGALKNALLIKITKWFEKTIYENAKHIITLSPGMYDGVIKTNIPSNKVSMIPNMSKIDTFGVRKKNTAIIKELGLQANSFKIVYFGSMGIANGMHYILDASKYLTNQKGIEFVFLGVGPTEPELKQRCKEENITNMNFFGGVDTQKLSEIINSCDASLVTFADYPILATNSPNKFFDSLSAGKPIIVNSPGWTKDIVEEYECGLFANPKNPKDLAKKITFLKDNPNLCKKMGENSRALAETKYDKSILCAQFVNVVNSL